MQAKGQTMTNVISDAQQPRYPSHIVAIGVSAGGLAALESFFDAIDNNLGCAYIVIQHLSPDFKSMMDKLLSKHTSMDIVQAQDGQLLYRDKVYLVPAGQFLQIVDGIITLANLPKENRISLPINAIFTRLSIDAHIGLVGIILSGTGSDGCRGIVALKEIGALVIAQDPNEAQFSGMPQSAIATGAVDFTLQTNEMPQYIKNYVSHPLATAESETFKYHLSENTDVIRNILELILSETGLDFSTYKESTISRRIKHRLSVRNLASLSDYWAFLQSNHFEIELIKQDLLIGVTQFFRDGHTWQTLKEDVIVQLINNSDKDTPIRVWCAGCSTGEEAFSIAMLIDDVCNELDVVRNLTIFASDIDQAAVSYASNGLYPVSISDEIPHHYLEKYFTKVSDEQYQIDKKLRAKIVFATHNMIDDPPFSNINFISCRNTLIYLQESAQQRVFGFFHYALVKSGFLLLGSSETPAKLISYFPVLDSTNHIYQKSNDVSIPISEMSSVKLKSRLQSIPSSPTVIKKIIKKDYPSVNKPLGLSHIQEQYLPPTFIINKQLQVVYSYGDTSLFTQKLGPGEVTIDIAVIVRADLVGSVISAAHEVMRKDNKVVMRNVLNDNKKSYSISCFGFLDEASSQRHLAISFIEYTTENAASTTDKLVSVYSLEDQTQQRIVELESAYADCQKMYTEVLDDLDTTSEELQTSNEELMATNEELQSTNEEIQSVNEELYTVNSEYQQKIIELTDANNDLESLLNATDLAILYLDSELNIRRYTRPIQNFINIMDFDINRPFKDLSLKFKMDNVYDIIEQVNSNGKNHYSVIELQDTNALEISINPYSIGKDNQGVVLSIREKNE